MYLPKKFNETDQTRLLQHIRNYPLAALILATDETLDAEYLPLQVTGQNGALKLKVHIAKANPLWKKCVAGQQVLLLFQGEQGYISPNYYPSKAEHGKVVPTWNYAVVQVKGKVYFKHEPGWLMQLLADLSAQQELSQAQPWSISDAPKSYIDKLLKAVVGIEIEVEQITGKFKLSQNKSGAEYQGVVQGLMSSERQSEHALAKKMEL